MLALLTRTLRRKVGLGRVSVPIWGVCLLVAVLAASGQVGKALTGETVGTVELVVEQAITLDTAFPLGRNPIVVFVSGQGDAASTRNDEGTSFTVAVEMHNGQSVDLIIFLSNNAGTGIEDAGTVLLELTVPDGINIALTELPISDISEAQLNATTWLIVVPGGTGTSERPNAIALTVKPTDIIPPGFYTITGRFIQIEGG